MKEKLRKIALGSGLVGALAGCAGERTPPVPNQMGCEGFTGSRITFGGAKMIDLDCDGSIDIVKTIPTSGDGIYTLILSPSYSGMFGTGNPHPRGAVVMTPEMQALADSIYSLQKRLYFLEDSTRYWANETGDTTNLRGSFFVESREQGKR